MNIVELALNMQGTLSHLVGDLAHEEPEAAAELLAETSADLIAGGDRAATARAKWRAWCEPHQVDGLPAGIDAPRLRHRSASGSVTWDLTLPVPEIRIERPHGVAIRVRLTADGEMVWEPHPGSPARPCARHWHALACLVRGVPELVGVLRYAEERQARAAAEEAA